MSTPPIHPEPQQRAPIARPGRSAVRDTAPGSDVGIPSPAADEASARAAAGELRRALAARETRLEIRLSEDSPRRFVVSVTDRESGELIRQIPAEHLLRVARFLQRHGSGLFHDTA